jgi:hypothetical protein
LRYISGVFLKKTHLVTLASFFDEQKSNTGKKENGGYSEFHLRRQQKRREIQIRQKRREIQIRQKRREIQI